MKRYEAYKNCNIPWIKQIPSHWMTKRAKFLYKKEQRPVREEDSVVTCFRDGVVTLRKNRRTTGFTEAISEFGYQGIRKGDLVIHVMDAFAGAIGVSDSDGKGTPVYNVCTAYGDSNNYYYAYALREMARAGFIQSLYRGIRERSSDFRFDVFERQYLPVPPREEQDQIVRYLDWQVSKINRLIAAKRKRIELVKEHFSVRIANIVCNGLKPNTPMRETGIDYIGAIPSHWTVLQNKRLFKSMNRTFQGIPTVLSLSQKDGLIPYSEMTERSLHTSSYESWQLVCPNDLVLNRFKAHLGVFFASKYTGIVTFHYGVYETKMPLVAKYYEVLYHTPEYCRVYAGQSRGMTVGLQNLSDTNFYSTYTVYPPNEEQREIVTEIEQIEKQQSSIIAGVNRQIEKLQEFRTRLISDVVTGQIDVRSIKVPDDEYINNEITEEEFEEESENNEEE